MVILGSAVTIRAVIPAPDISANSQTERSEGLLTWSNKEGNTGPSIEQITLPPAVAMAKTCDILRGDIEPKVGNDLCS